jgi:hypothetical protein
MKSKVEGSLTNANLGKRTGGIAQVEEYYDGKHETLSSIPTTKKMRTKEIKAEINNR